MRLFVGVLICIFTMPSTAFECDGGPITGTITLHADRDSLLDAFYADLSGTKLVHRGRELKPREAFPPDTMRENLNGFWSADGTSLHALRPRSAKDRRRIYAIGHEVLHLACGSWHEGRSAGWGDS